MIAYNILSTHFKIYMIHLTKNSVLVFQAVKSWDLYAAVTLPMSLNSF